MISNQILQGTIEGLKGIARIDICVMDTEGNALATTMGDTSAYTKAVLDFVDSPAESQVVQGFQFFKVFEDSQLEYVILAKGDSEDVYMIGPPFLDMAEDLLQIRSNRSFRGLSSRLRGLR